VQPLQSVNCHDSRAHCHEQHGPCTRLVGFGWFGSGRLLGLDGFCYRGETCELCLVLATGVRHESFVWSGYRGETCKLVALGYSLSNQGAVACLVVV
jgi:hypothetical protein